MTKVATERRLGYLDILQGGLEREYNSRQRVGEYSTDVIPTIHIQCGENDAHYDCSRRQVSANPRLP